jgi:hypothetical protein
MVDWTILSPTYLTAVVEWAGAAVTVLAVGAGGPTSARGFSVIKCSDNER